jgi:hypothetical protein
MGLARADMGAGRAEGHMTLEADSHSGRVGRSSVLGEGEMHPAPETEGSQSTGCRRVDTAHNKEPVADSDMQLAAHTGFVQQGRIGQLRHKPRDMGPRSGTRIRDIPAGTRDTDTLECYGEHSAGAAAHSRTSNT